MEDLVSALVNLDKVQKYADIDKDKFYDVEAKNVRMHDFAPNQNNTSTQALPKKPDTSIENSGIGGQKSMIKWSDSTELPCFQNSESPYLQKLNRRNVITFIQMFYDI